MYDRILRKSGPYRTLAAEAASLGAAVQVLEQIRDEELRKSELLEARISELEAERAAQAERVLLLEAQFQNAETDRASQATRRIEIETAHNVQAERLVLLEAEYAAQRERLVLLEGEKAALNRRVEELARNLEELEAVRAGLLAEVKRLSASQVAQIESQHAEIEAGRAALTARDNLEERLRELERSGAVYLDHIGRLEKERGELQAANQREAARSTLVDERARILERAEATLAAQINEYENTRKTYLDHLNNLTREITTRLDELQVRNGNITGLILGKLSVLEYKEGASKSRPPVKGGEAGISLYLDLLERALTGALVGDPSISPWSKKEFDPATRFIGRDWPAHAYTMIGTARMRNVRHLVEQILAEGIPGDLIETGVWRGGACIYMRGILHAYGDINRKVWVADSFRGLPPPDVESFPADAGDIHHRFQELAVSVEQVKSHFQAYDLLDENVKFLEGWFKETLPNAPIEKLALIRLDGDMYESTIQALEALYPKLQPGGYLIIDDYVLDPCRKAVDEFRTQRHINAPLEQVDGAAVYWRKDESQRKRAGPAKAKATPA